MALLGGFEGFDDETKDEFGMTEAQRRQPLWSGLIKAGLLGVAAGGEMMPADRAKAIGQIGGAIGDIPGEMMQYRSSAAQQALRGQQVREGRDKLAQREKVRKLAATPEFQNDLMALPPHVQQIVKLQIEAGDMDAVSRTMANAAAQTRQAKQDDLSQKREDRLAGHADTSERRQQAEFELRKQEAERKAAEDERKKNLPYQGTGLEGQMWNDLINQPPDSEKYAIARDHLSKERQLPDGTKVQGANLERYPEATFSRVPKLKPGDAPPENATPVQHGQTLNPGDNRQLPDGTIVTKDSQGTIKVEPPDADPIIYRPGQPKLTQAPQKLDPHELRELNKMKVGRDKYEVAAKDFMNEWNRATPQERALAVAGKPSTLTSARTNLVALAKEAAIFNLGVLTGGDKEFLEGAIADPQKFMSLAADEKLVTEQVSKISRILKAGIGSQENNLLYPPQIKPGTKPREDAAKAGGDKPKVKVFRDGKFVEE